MNKNQFLVMFSIVAIGLSSFITKSVNTVYKVSKEDSKISWLGKKVTGQHTGHIKLSDGSLEFKNNKLAGGKFVIDMTSISNEDIEDAGMKQKLEGHLKSDDFFGVEKHPTASFVITKVVPKSGNDYTVTGNLTIKNITKSIEFPATVKFEGGKATATAKITVDRSKFDIKYGSGSFFDNLGDKMIYDDFELNVALVAK